ncbi:MAG: hypothetical protein R3Y35_07150 [Clostridia bacterium]
MKKSRYIIVGVLAFFALVFLIIGILICIALFFGKSVDTSSLTSSFDDFIYAYENDTSFSRDLDSEYSIEKADIVFAEDGSTYTLDLEIVYTGELESEVEIQVYGSEDYYELSGGSTALLSTKTSDEIIVLIPNIAYTMSRTSVVVSDAEELEQAFSYVYVEIVGDNWHSRIMVPVS